MSSDRDSRRSSLRGLAHFVDFTHIRFRRKKRDSRKSTEDLYTHLNDSDWTLATISSLKDEKERYPIIDKEEEPETVEEGLFIRLASHSSKPPSRPLSENRLARLKYRIAKAVVAAGMECSPQAPSPEAARPFDNALRAIPPGPASSFYSGTYGQVMVAFISAGLEAVPCHPRGFDGGAYLGAMFVSRHTHTGSIELTKLSLWA